MRLWILTDTQLNEQRQEYKNLLRLRGGPRHFYLDVERKLLEVVKEIEYREKKLNLMGGVYH